MKIIESKDNCKKENIILIFEYLFLSFIIPLLCILLLKISANNIISFVLYGIEGASPALSVIILVFAHDGKNGFKKYIHDKYIDNFKLKNCILGFLTPFLILTCAKIVAIYIGDEYIFLSPIKFRKIIIISWALVAEELGWRGYLQEKFETILTDKYIPVFVGIIWALWHYHFILSGSMEVPIIPFALGCIFESFGYFAITKYSKNNIVPASIWHFSGNMMFNLYRFDPKWHNGNTCFYWITTIFYALNVFIFVIYEKRIARGCK